MAEDNKVGYNNVMLFGFQSGYSCSLASYCTKSVCLSFQVTDEQNQSMLVGNQASLLYQSRYQQIHQNSWSPKVHQLSIFQILSAFHAPLTTPACSVARSSVLMPRQCSHHMKLSYIPAVAHLLCQISMYQKGQVGRSLHAMTRHTHN